MPKAQWGLKRVCQHCSAHFYDLCKNPIICPKCAHTFDPDLLLKHKRSRGGAAAVPKELPEVPLFDALVEEMSFTVEGEVLGDDVLIEDTSDLGGEDDMKEVIDHRSEEEGI